MTSLKPRDLLYILKEECVKVSSDPEAVRSYNFRYDTQIFKDLHLDEPIGKAQGLVLWENFLSRLHTPLQKRPKPEQRDYQAGEMICEALDLL